MLTVGSRQLEILSTMSGTGRASVNTLAEQFSVTSETIRRDLRQMEARGLLQRVHGGALLPASPTFTLPGPVKVPGDPPNPVHLSLGMAAAKLIDPSTKSIFLDAGATTCALATVLGQLHSEASWAVVTNSPAAGVLLARAGAMRLTVLGGRISRKSGAVTGPEAVATLETMRADIAFLEAGGISCGHGLTTSDSATAAVKQKMMDNAGTSVVLCESSKFEHISGVAFADLSDVDVLVTDTAATEEIRTTLSAHNIQMVTP